MIWKRQWDALGARIDGFVDAVRAFVPAPILPAVGASALWPTKEVDPKGIYDSSFFPAVSGIFASLNGFLVEHRESLPEAAAALLANLVATHRDLLAVPLAVNAHNINVLRSQAAVLAGFRTELSYALRDTQVHLRRLVERAFVHIQRSIVADPGVQERWKAAFDTNENACEKLGAVHLLLHGLWAFKAHSIGERTDLVTQQPLAEDEIQRIGPLVDGLVLTEWKVVRTSSEALSKMEEALLEARQYGKGSLAGFELTSARYVVLVSKDFLPNLVSRVDGGTTYTIVNIAVQPSSPSVIARILSKNAA